MKFRLSTDAAKSFTQQILSIQQQQQQSLFVLLPYVKFIAKILEIKFEYWLPGITIGASGKPGSQLTSALNENKLQVSKMAQINTHTRDTHKDRESNVIDITTRNYYYLGSLKGDLHGTTLSHATRLRQAYNTNCFV